MCVKKIKLELLNRGKKTMFSNYKMKGILYVAFFIISQYTIQTINAQTWNNAGLSSAKVVNAVSFSPQNTNILYAGAFGWGIYKSTDGGSSWTNLRNGLASTYVRSVIAVSTDTVFAGTNDGIFKTYNGGLNWSLSLSTLNSIRDIVCDTKTNYLYAVTYGSGMYKSTNRGISWSSIVVTDNVSAKTMTHLRSVAVFGRDSLYVGGSISDVSTGGALFKSTNGGTNWVQVQRSIGIRSSVKSIAISPGTPKTSLIIGTASKGVYKSTNAGTNWTEINGATTPNPIYDLKINAVAFGSSYRYAGSDSLGKFYYRALGDSTVGWFSGNGLPGSSAVINSIEINPTVSSTLFLNTEGGGVYKSTNSGIDWQAQNNGMTGIGAKILQLNGSGNIFVGTEFGDGLWNSTNSGASWTKYNLATSNTITSIGVTNSTLKTYAGVYGTGIFKTINGGVQWLITDTTIMNTFIRCLEVDLSNDDIVYTGTGNGVYKTTNGGVLWFAVNSGIPSGTSIRTLLLDHSNSSILYAGSDSNYLYKTTNAGNSWTNVTNANGFLTQDRFVRTITINGTMTTNLYSGADSGRIYKSTNSGSSWTLLIQLPTVNSVRRILIHPQYQDILFAATFGGGIFISTDSGTNWSQMNNGLSDLEIYSLESDSTNPLNLYAGTASHGVEHTTFTVYTISASSGVNGTISPSGTIPVVAGVNKTFNITPSTSSYHIADVAVDGLTVGAVPSYTFTTVNANHTISASFAMNTYTLTVSATNGSVTKNPNTPAYNQGTSVQLTAVPNVGYHFTNWSGDASGSTNPMSVVMDGNKNITASFAINTYTLNVSATNGSVTKNPDLSNYNYSTIVQLSAVPNSGFHFLSWSGDTSGSSNPISVFMNANKNITASFTSSPLFTINASSGVNGAIVPTGVVNVAQNTNQLFTFTPISHYHISDVLVDGSSIGAPQSYSFTNVTLNHTIAVSFSLNTYSIIASAGANGTISPSGTITVNYGIDTAFTIVPNTGYHISSVFIDGEFSAGAVSTYKFTTVASNHSIAASFSIDVFTLTISMTGKGTVNKNPNLTQYETGTSVTLTAIPFDSTWAFTEWSGDASGITNPLTIVMDAAKIITANFSDVSRFRTLKVQTALSDKPIKLKKRKDGTYPLPNIATVRDTIIKRIGKLVVGKEQLNKDSAKIYGWLGGKKGADVGKFFKALHSGACYPLDSNRSGKKVKAFVKAVKFDRNKYNNPLAAELTVLKMNIIASKDSIFPFNFGNLELNLPSSPFNGMQLKTLADTLDFAMTYWRKLPMLTDTTQAREIKNLLQSINETFYDTLNEVGDIVSYNPLKLKGMKLLSEVAFLRRSAKHNVEWNWNQQSSEEIPQENQLMQNYPNPFNPKTIIGYQLSAPSVVTMKIYNILGRELATLLNNEQMDEGQNEIVFDASALASGVYFYRLSVANESGNFALTKKLMLMK